MPREFNELTTKDLIRIFRRIQDNTELFEHPTCATRYDIIKGLALIEYKITSSVEIPANHNNPDYSINIYSDFNIILTGFNQEDNDFIENLVKRYLKQNEFL